MARLSRNHTWLIFALALTLTIVLVGRAFANSEKLSPNLAQKIDACDGRVRVVAFLNTEKQSVLNKATAMHGMARAQANHAQLVQDLLAASARSSPFVDFVHHLADSGHVSNIVAYWIADAVSFSVDVKSLDQIANHPDLHYLIEDQPLQLIDPVSTKQSEPGNSGSDDAMQLTGVRELWNRGCTGHGRLVCSFDTGVEGTHPALANSWLGANGGTHLQSWFDPYGTTSPTDNNGHGTHTMGIMVGRDGADTIGVAFDARWMCASVIDRGQTLNKTVSDIIAAFQWAADPDGNPQTVDDLPDVVCNSWGIPRGLFAPCDQTFWQAIDNLEALGVVVIFACGNEGPNPATIRNPADRTSSPTNSFSIGAVDQTQIDLPIAPFSSRGPASCDSTEIKPEIVAPGVSIRSSFKGGGYKLMSGTSMAAPFVAGCIALMREYNPEATVEEIKNALIQSASDLGSTGKDNNYGWGFINVARALNYLPQPHKPKISVEDIRLAQTPTGILAVGRTTELELSIIDSVVAADNLYSALHSNNSHASVLVDSVSFGSLASGERANNYGNPFLVKLDSFAQYGSAMNFTVDFFSKYHGYLNSVDFQLVAGQPVIAASRNLMTDRLNFEVTNFGISRKLYDANIGTNPLTQMSLMVADRQGTIYDGLPGDNNFVATDSLTDQVTPSGREMSTRFSTVDQRLQITQTANVYNSPAEQGFVLLDYDVASSAPPDTTNSYFALAIDVDFFGGETTMIDGNSFIFRNSSSDRFVGIRLLSQETAFAQAVSGGIYKSGGLDETQKYGMVSSGQTSLSEGFADYALIISAKLTVQNDSKAQIGAVLASGSSLEEVRAELQTGEEKYSQTTGTDAGNGATLPTSISLEQNYPNPFNSETRIEFSLPTKGDFKLEIINTLGRTVTSIDGNSIAGGLQSVTWNGKDDHGRDVASGIYFYKISFAGASLSRKMVLLK